jgi:hypothetical protein
MDGGGGAIARPVSGNTSHEVRADWLLGTWQLLHCDAPLEIAPGTRMQFDSAHRLTYIIPTGEGAMSVELHWRVAGQRLYTQFDDGSNPLDVGVTLGTGDVLVVDFNGAKARYVRASG